MKTHTLLYMCCCVVILGSIYTVARKWQNVAKSPGLDGQESAFHHPIYQVFWLFFGMVLCLPVQKLTECLRGQPASKFNPLMMLVPAACDVAATILDSIGLVYTHVSVHQMLKGFIVVFAGIFSWLFFGRVLKLHQWVGILLIVAGTFTVGFTNFQWTSDNVECAPHPLLGNLLVLAGQVFLAAMFVYEEKILNYSSEGHQVPILCMVGWEGLWGIILSAGAVGIFFSVPGDDMGHLENFIQASVQITHSPALIVAFVLTTAVIGPFNYYGSLITKHLSAVHRCTIDATRMFTVWTFSLIAHWESFNKIQGVGYIILLLGTCIHNEVIRIPGIYKGTSMGDTQRLKGPLPSHKRHHSPSKKSFCDVESWLRRAGLKSAAADLNETAPLISKEGTGKR